MYEGVIYSTWKRRQIRKSLYIDSKMDSKHVSMEAEFAPILLDFARLISNSLPVKNMQGISPIYTLAQKAAHRGVIMK